MLLHNVVTYSFAYSFYVSFAAFFCDTSNDAQVAHASHSQQLSLKQQVAHDPGKNVTHQADLTEMCMTPPYIICTTL